ncbi:hypothetical protein N9A94_02085 [Akkermansiaceae bacterium]|nr:hypothetical protein [Akkermansiaceae bacterium]
MEIDLQKLIPEAHRDLVEAVPKGFYDSAVLGGILFGCLVGALLCMLVSQWMIPIVFAVLLVIQRLWVWKSDKKFDQRMSDLKSQGLTWETENDS